MARDLIPPSSPAGRPAPDGTPNLIELPPEPPRSPAEPPMREPVGPSQFRNRFGFLLGALAGIFIAAVLVGRRRLQHRPRRAAHRRGEHGAELVEVAADRTAPSAGAVEIAEKVSARVPRRERQAARGGHGRARSRPASSLRGPSGITDLVDTPGVTYEIDGLGPLKSIPGKGSAERLQLIQREALELALYTFRYLPEVQQVVTKLPPPPPTEEQKRAEAKAQAVGKLAQAAVEQAQTERRREGHHRGAGRDREGQQVRDGHRPRQGRGARSSTARATSGSSCRRRSAHAAGQGRQARTASRRPSWPRSTR